MLGVKVGELAGRFSDSTFVAVLTSFLLYSGLLFAGWPTELRRVERLGQAIREAQAS